MLFLNLTSDNDVFKCNAYRAEDTDCARGRTLPWEAAFLHLQVQVNEQESPAASSAV